MKSYHRINVEIDGYRGRQLQNVSVCYNFKCLTLLKYNLNWVYIGSWTPPPHKLIFRDDWASHT
jgi:hypothetical protein